MVSRCSTRLQFRIAGVTLVALLTAASLTSCAAQPEIGVPRSVDGGTQVVVPALWANGEKNIGGIEPATIWVDTDRTSDQLAYEVNLADVEAKGGGAQWRAATSSAAAIGTLFSGFDPDDIAYRFDITGPIDGPSAGGILTIGVLAAIFRQPLDSKTTMTGTISPDGSIGPVGLIGQKLKAASEAGYTRALIPAILTEIADPETGEPVDTAEFGKGLGIDVTFVRTVADAYEAFTGQALIPGDDATEFVFANFPSLDAAREAATSGLQQDLAQLLVEHPDAPEAVVAQLDESRRVSATGDWETAFALAVDTLDQLSQWIGVTRFEAMLSEGGLDAAREQLNTRARQSIDEISVQVTAAVTESETFSTDQRLALPGALGWLTYSRAVLESMVPELSASAAESETNRLTAYSGLAEQVILESELLFPRVMQVLRGTPVDTSSADKSVEKFVSGYTNYLVAAGDSNLEYLREVAGLDERIADQFSVLELVPVAEQLGVEAAAIRPEPEPISVEMEQSSTAMTYFVVTTSLVSSFELFGSPDLWLSPENASIAGNAYLEESIEQSDALVQTTSNALLADGVNGGFPLWSAQWGTAAYFALSAQDRGSTGASIAFNELWYDVITVLSMRAFVSPQ